MPRTAVLSAPPATCSVVLRRRLWPLFCLCFALLTGCSGDGAAPVIVLITLDTTRQDHVNPYPGSPRGVTPVFARLAGEGLLCADMNSNVPLTLPAHATILTGLLPPAHEVRVNFAQSLPPAAETVAELLAARGKQTAAFVSAPVLARRWGIGQGFERYDAPEGRDRPGSETTARALRWLESASDEFFLWVHYFDPHTPYEPPAGIAARFVDDPYAGEVAAADAEVGQLVAALDQRLGRGGYFLLIVGDHGEGLDDHGELEHGVFIYDEAVKAPCLLRWPGHVAAGSVMEQACSLTDVAPTLLAAAGIPVPAHMTGRDLLAPAEISPLPIYLESMFGEQSMGWAPLSGVRLGPWKMIAAPRRELYHLRDDPHEQHNLAAENPKRLGALEAELASLTTRIESIRPYRLAGADGEGASGPVHVLDPATMKELLSLGYLAPGSGQGPANHESAQGGDGTPTDPKDGIQYHRHFEVGKQLLFEEQWVPAIAEFELLLAQYPQHTPALFDLCTAQRQAGHLQDAVSTCRRILAINENNALAFFYLGGLMVDLGRMDEAIRAYEAAATDPYFTINARWLIATGLAQHGKHVQARGRFAQAREAGPCPAPWMEEMQERNEQILAAQATLSDRPQDAEGYHQLSNLQTRIGRPADAMATLQQAVDAKVATAETLYLLGWHRLSAGQAADGKRWLRAALDRDPAHLDAASHLALAHMVEGAYQEAQSVLRAAIEHHPQDPSLLYNLACVQSRGGEGREALATLQRAVGAGYDRIEKLRDDPDLAAARALPEFDPWIRSIEK